MADNQTNQLQWQAPEFRHYEKNIGWYITLVSVSVLIIAFFVIIEQDWFAAATIAIITAIVIGFSRKMPEEVSIRFDTKGLHINDFLFPYKQLKNFWVVHNERHSTVNFNTVTYINRTIILQLAGQDPDEVRNFLLRHLPEHHETGETLAQRIIHKFKF